MIQIGVNKYGITVLPILLLIFTFGCTRGVEAEKQSEIQIKADFVHEVGVLTNNQKVKEAFNYLQISDFQTIRDQIYLTEIPAPPFSEDVRGKEFANYLIKYGADSVWVDEIGNVIGLRKGTERKSVLAISAHLDTVFPEETDVMVEARGDTLIAPGISDDGRGLTSILAVLRALEIAEIETKDDILFIGSVGEEGLGDLRGMKHLFNDDLNINSFISIDGTGFESITNAGLGSHRYKITFKGPGGHSWGAFGMANPHHAASRAITYFVDSADKYTRSGPKTSYNVGRIGGGTSVNSIPFESWFEVDMRSVSSERLAQIDSLLQQSVRKGLKEQNNLVRSGELMTVEVKMIGNRPSGETSIDNPIVQRALAVTEWMDGKPELKMSSTDSNIPISLGIPALTLGGGGIGKGAHSLQEMYINNEGYKGIQRAFIIVIAQTGLNEL